MKKIVFILLFSSFSCMLLSQNRVVNEGVLKIEAGTDVYFSVQFRNQSGSNLINDGNLYLNNNFINNGTNTNNGFVQIEGDFRNNPGDTHINNGDFYVKRDFRNRGVTSATTGTTYLIGTIEQEIYKNTSTSPVDDVFFNNLVINNTSSTGVLVDDNFGIYVEGTLTLTSGDLRLVGEAQLIQGASSTVSSSGTGKLLRDSEGGSSVYAYNYFSSPVNNGGSYALNSEIYDGTDASINSFTPQLIQFNSGSPYNGVPAVVDGSGNVTTPLIISDDWLYTYTSGSGAYSEWVKITESTPINPGQGFTIKGTGTLSPTQNYVYKGTPNNGDYTFSGIVVDESYLLGNPYPSSLDADQFIMDNDAVDALLIWVDGGSTTHYLADYLGSYATRNLTGGAPPSVPLEIAGVGTSGSASPGQYVAIGQGFFVVAVSTDDITFSNSQRDFVTEAAGDSQFYRTNNSNSDEVVDSNKKTLIRIGYEDPEGFHRQLLLGFVPNSPADLNFNNGYDAFMSGARDDEMYFIIENDTTKKYVIQGVGAYESTHVIPLGITISDVGTHKIMLDAVENFNGSVYLYDTLLNQNHNLSKGLFELNLDAGIYEDRFQIVFEEQDSSLEIEDLKELGLNVYFDNSSNIVVNNTTGVTLNNIMVFNSLGQEMIRVDEIEYERTTILFNRAKGVYFVVIASENGKDTFKIIN